AVNRLGLALHSALHPVFRIWRGAGGGIERVDAGGATSGDGQSQLASFIHFEVDRCGDAALLDTLREDIARVLGDDAEIHFHFDARARLVAASGFGRAAGFVKDMRVARMLVERGADVTPAAVADVDVKLKSLVTAVT
ncbi:NAD-glutamate dehydrogenase, partial [Bacillus velezensis]|nr:NAD-glutamate dehydrogenase [Bacillus velezensis]